MVRFRPARPDDPAESRLAYDIFVPTIDELGSRTGGGANSTSEAAPSRAWETRRPLFEHLAATGDRWWFAEDASTGQAIGYARSILRDGTRELTEFFVLPEAQGGGVGRGLLERVFPADGASHRSIIATIDPKAIARYVRTGLPGKVMLAFVEGPPRAIELPTDLTRTPIDQNAPPLDEIGAIDRAILGFRRDVDHAWLASQRPGWLYRRGDAAVGYAYHPTEPAWGGPYATLDPADLPVVLAHAETAAAEAGHAAITFDMAMTNLVGWEHVLGRGFRVDPFVMVLYTDGPTEGMDRYVLTSPPFFA